MSLYLFFSKVEHRTNFQPTFRNAEGLLHIPELPVIFIDLLSGKISIRPVPFKSVSNLVFLDLELVNAHVTSELMLRNLL